MFIFLALLLIWKSLPKIWRVDEKNNTAIIYMSPFLHRSLRATKGCRKLCHKDYRKQIFQNMLTGICSNSFDINHQNEELLIEFYTSVTLISTSGVPQTHIHTYGQFSMKIRRILRQTPKKTLARLGESLTEQHSVPDKSVNTTDTLPSSASTENEHRICLFSDSPHYIVRVR